METPVKDELSPARLDALIAEWEKTPIGSLGIALPAAKIVDRMIAALLSLRQGQQIWMDEADRREQERIRVEQVCDTLRQERDYADRWRQQLMGAEESMRAERDTLAARVKELEAKVRELEGK